MPPFWDAAEQLQAVLDLLIEALNCVTIKAERMLERAEENYSTISDLVDALVLTEGVPFRIAHKIVGTTVRSCIEQGLHPKDIRIEMLNAAGQQQLSRGFRMSQSELDHILTAEYSVANRKSAGSPARDSCVQMHEALSRQLSADEAAQQERSDHLEAARQLLRQEAGRLLPQLV